MKEWILESSRNCQNNLNINQEMVLNNSDSETKNDESFNCHTSTSKSIIDVKERSSAFHIIDLMDKLKEREDHIRQVCNLIIFFL